MTRFASDSRLIFDLGMNNGDDAASYLARGYDVVAVDANPSLCAAAGERFARDIADGRLTVINAAIWDTPGEATFFVNLDNDHWSSIDIGWAGRDNSRCSEISVRCVTLNELFGEFGVPLYLKIDVEGADHVVLAQLRQIGRLPLYVSVEDCRFGFDYMETLAACGYDGFKLLDQSTVVGMTDRATGRPYPRGSSGPFGADVPGQWLPYPAMVAHYSSCVRDREGNRLAPRTRWWDIHCTHSGTARAQ
jgi:FkbM family methyltransferase